MRFCQAIGKYDPTTSSSSKVSNKSNELRYGIGSANITYVLDDINVPPSQRTMKGVQFGVAKTSKDQFAGILGIGHGQGVNTAYKNFIDQLADQGITNTKAYSVALGSKSDKSGVVVFGGVDTAKYSGALAPLPIIPANKSPDGVARFWLTLQSMQHTSSRGKTTDLSTKPMPVFLDTGATLSLLPPDLSAAVAQSFGATKMDASGFYTVDCELAKRNGTLDFNFDGVTIHVPYKEIMREIQSTPPSCYLGIMPSTSFTLLGDTFLRSAYGESSAMLHSSSLSLPLFVRPLLFSHSHLHSHSRSVSTLALIIHIHIHTYTTATCTHTLMNPHPHPFTDQNTHN